MITLYRIIKFGIQGFFRNLALSFNATFIMTLTLITLSVFFVLNLVVTDATKKLETRLDVTVFLRDSAKDEEVKALINTLDAQAEVSQIHLMDKSDLLDEWREMFKDEPEFRDLITAEDNPLLRELRIQTRDPINLTKVAGFVEREEYQVIIDDISFRENQGRIITFINFSKFLRKVSLIISLAFTVISLLVVFTTIRLTIFSRREEIEIMRLVGANYILVKAPFLLEGILYGILATLFAELLAWLAIWAIRPLESQYLRNGSGALLFGNQNQDFLTIYADNIGSIIVSHLFVGVFVGLISSIIAIRKYLK